MQQDEMHPYSIDPDQGPEIVPNNVMKFRQRSEKNKARMKKAEEQFRRSFRHINHKILDEEIRLPPIIYVANKAENDLQDKLEFEEKFHLF